MRIVLAFCLAVGLACGAVVAHAETVSCEDGKAMLSINGIKGQMSGEHGPLTCAEYQAWYGEATRVKPTTQTDRTESAVDRFKAAMAKRKVTK